MDPLTQGLLGAAASQAVFGKKLPRTAWVIGLLGGMMPDLDVLIKSSTDPTVAWLYHRHFTHSVFFIPIGGLITAGVLMAFRQLRSHFGTVFGAATVAVATHGLLDALTSYGTVLWWPLSNARVSWDLIGIIDFFFTGILLMGLVIGVIMQRRLPAILALSLAMGYVGMGAVHRNRALTVQSQLAEARGHVVERGRAFPLPGSLVLWRSVYAHDGEFHADGIRVPWIGSPLLREGGSRPAMDPLTPPEVIAGEPRLARAYRILHWFSDEFVVPMEEEMVFGDFRYAGDNEGVFPIWGLRFDVETAAVERWSGRPSGDYASRMWRRLTRGDPEYRPVEEVINETERRTATVIRTDSAKEEPL